MLGALQGGIAFSNSSVALVHGMSRPIGAHFHVAHGLSNAMLMPLVTAWSAPAALPRYADCARAMGLADHSESDQGAVGRLIEGLERINADLGVPTPAAYGIAKQRWDELVPLMAQQALASGSPANNPRIPGADDIEALYRQAYRPVRWVEVVRALRARGVTHVVECGPGKVLAGLTRRIDAELASAVVHDPASLAEAKGMLA